MDARDVGYGDTGEFVIAYYGESLPIIIAPMVIDV
jgi:hypothetical protein